MMNLNVIIVIIYSVIYAANAATTSTPHVTNSTLTTDSQPTTIPTTVESSSDSVTTSPTTLTSESHPTEPLFPPPRRIFDCIPTPRRTPRVKLTCDANSNDYITVPQAVWMGYLLENATCSNVSNVYGCEQYHSHSQYVGSGCGLGDLGNMAGRAPGWHQLDIAGNNRKCNNMLKRTDGDYNIINYDCINKNDISTLCGSDNRTSEILYVWSFGYPRDIGLPERCRCMIHTSAQQIVVQVYDNRMACSQSLVLTDGKNTSHRWSCDNNFDHMTETFIQLQTRTFALKWDGGNNTDVARTGKVFVRLRATDRSPLSIQCLGHGPSSSRVLPADDIIPATKLARQCSELNTNFVTLSCPPSQVIGLHSIALGFLKNGTCAINGAIDSCEQDHTKYQYLGEEGNSADRGDLEKVSGITFNQSPVAKQGVSGKCIPRNFDGSQQYKNADYIAAYYDCIEKSDITTMCKSSSPREGNTVYIWNDGYPDNGDFKERTCQCSINTTAAKVVVQTYDNRLLCSQRLELRQDNGRILLMPWRCDPDFHHILTNIVHTDGAPFTLDWKSNDETSRAKTGKFWIRIRAFNDTKSPMSIQCFEPVYPTTTTIEATTAPMTTPMTTSKISAHDRLDGLCVDKVPHCKEYDDGSLCTSQSYYSWAYENCRNYCKFDVCNDTCVDNENLDCGVVDLALNLCADKQKAKNICRKYCNLCNMVDGSWAHWASWSECSASCGNGTRNRTRDCTDPAPKDGGLNCTGTASELQPCEGPACPVHGNWGSWNDWGLCSVSCDVGMQRRDRACDSPYPNRQGDHCFGTPIEYRVCLPGACADGEWSEWGDWSNCSSGCGGVRERERNCSNPEPSAVGRQCLGNNVDTEKCSCGVPSFTATNLISGLTSGTVTFSSVLFTEGNDYNVTSGVFTCSVPGLYHFTASLTKKNSTSVYHAYCHIRLNGATKIYININPKDTSNNGYGSYSASASVVWRLDVRDTVDLGSCTSASYFDGATSVFTGFLVNSDQ